MLYYLLLLEDESDRAEFEALYQECHELTLRLSFHCLKDHALAEDAVHDAFCSVAKNFEKISGKSCQQKRSYLVITVKRKCIDIIRREKRYRHMAEYSEELTLPYDRARIEQKVQEMQADTREAARLILELPELYRSVLECRLLLEMSNKECAKKLGITEDTCAKRFERGRKMVAKQLEKEGIHL